MALLASSNDSLNARVPVICDLMNDDNLTCWDGLKNWAYNSQIKNNHMLEEE